MSNFTYHKDNHIIFTPEFCDSCQLTKNWIITSAILNSVPIFPTRQKIWRKKEVNMTWETINQYFVIIVHFQRLLQRHIVTITVTLEWKRPFIFYEYMNYSFTIAYIIVSKFSLKYCKVRCFYCYNWCYFFVEISRFYHEVSTWVIY